MNKSVIKLIALSFAIICFKEAFSEHTIYNGTQNQSKFIELPYIRYSDGQRYCHILNDTVYIKYIIKYNSLELKRELKDIEKKNLLKYVNSINSIVIVGHYPYIFYYAGTYPTYIIINGHCIYYKDGAGSFWDSNPPSIVYTESVTPQINMLQYLREIVDSTTPNSK